MAQGYGMAQESVSVTGIWESALPHTVPPLRLCPCWSPLPALPWAASASIRAEVISQRSHGNRSCVWLGHGKGQARRRIWDSYFSQGQGKESSVPQETETPRGQGLAQGHLAVSCGVFSPSSMVERKIKRDNHYRGPLLRNALQGTYPRKY